MLAGRFRGDVYYRSNGSTSLDGVPVSGTSTAYSIKIEPGGLGAASIQLFWGAQTGTFSVWMSNKEMPNEATDADWTQVQLARPIVQPAGVAGNDYVDLTITAFFWLRVKYVNISGAGDIHAYAAGK